MAFSEILPKVKIVHGPNGINDGDVSIFNGLPVELIGPITAFDEIAVAERTPQVQVKFPYGINTEVVQALTNNAASSVSVTNGRCSVTCAGAAEAFSQIRSVDTLRYGPGQGGAGMFTSAFTAGVANSSQVAGVGDDDEGFFFGYDGTAFGVLHRKYGELEVRTLTITAGAVTATGNITITMDGTAVVVGVTVGDTINEVCAAIVAASADFLNAGRGWEVSTSDNTTVVFLSLVSENATGTFSFADTDTTGVAAGTFDQATTEIEGAEPIVDWIPQADWNKDTMLDGNGASGQSLVYSNLNVFQVRFEFLGAGSVEYGIEDKATGRFQTVHVIEYAGTSEETLLRNPTMNMSIIVKTEAEYSGGALTVKTGSLAAFIEGKEAGFGVRHSAGNLKETTGSTPLNLLTIVNKLSFQGTRNKVEVFPDLLTLSSEALKTVTFRIIKNPTEVGGTPSLSEVDAANSVVETDIAGTTIVGGTTVATFTLIGSGAPVIDLTPYRIAMRPGDRLVFAADLSIGAEANVSAGVSWVERI